MPCSLSSPHLAYAVLNLVDTHPFSLPIYSFIYVLNNIFMMHLVSSRNLNRFWGSRDKQDKHGPYLRSFELQF